MKIVGLLYYLSNYEYNHEYYHEYNMLMAKTIFMISICDMDINISLSIFESWQ